MKITTTSKKRIASIKEYIDALQENYSKLCIVRLDMGYKKPYSEEMSFEEVNKDINRILNNRRNNQSIYEHNVGYILKKEYTEDKGFHIHAIFIFDGQKVQKDVHKADQIGKYWEEQITKGKGTYYNCNKNSYPEHGIGMINYSDKEKRKNLDKVISYLCKDEQHINEDLYKNFRSIVRGIKPKKKTNAGRPRSNKF